MVYFINYLTTRWQCFSLGIHSDYILVFYKYLIGIKHWMYYFIFSSVNIQYVITSCLFLCLFTECGQISLDMINNNSLSVCM